jgi:hypothetical protein
VEATARYPPRQHRDGDPSDTPARAGDEDLAVAGEDAAVLERQDAEHRREACSADLHRLQAGEGLGQGHEPTAVEPRTLGEAAPVALADAISRG